MAYLDAALTVRCTPCGFTRLDAPENAGVLREWLESEMEWELPTEGVTMVNEARKQHPDLTIWLEGRRAEN